MFKTVYYASKAANYIVLKYFTRAKPRRLHNIGSINIPKNAVRPAAKCRFCFNSWNNLPYKVRIEPKPKISSCSKKILRRKESQANLRPVEKSLLKKLESSSKTNNLVNMN
jgi:Domain of unknown function (DUF4674)